MVIYSIIPARGGSKRIPQKNIIDLNGTALIEWTINDSLNSSLINKTFVSTDNNDIAKVASKAGASIIKRPENLCLDNSTTEEAIEHFLFTVPRPDIVVLMQCTGPFRSFDQIDKGIEKLLREGADSLFFGSPVGRWLWTTENFPLNYNPTRRIMTQDKKWELIEGSDYIFRTSLFERTKLRLAGKITHQIIEKKYSIDIDDETDITTARALASAFKFDPKR